MFTTFKGAIRGRFGAIRGAIRGRFCDWRDAAGNITSCTVSDGTNTFVYDQNNRLTSYNGQAVTYDMDGNMLSATLNGTQMSFVYDSATV